MKIPRFLHTTAANSQRPAPRFRWCLLPALFTLGLSTLAAQSAAPAISSVQPSLQRQVLSGHLPAAVARLTPSGQLDGAKQLHLAIGLPAQNRDALAAFIQQVSDPTSPRYRHYLTAAQFGAMFGPAEQDYQAVRQFAQAHHLTVTTTYPSRLVLDVSGSVRDIEEALHITLRTYRHPRENREFFAPDVEPSLDLTVPLLHISGLDDYSLRHPADLHVKPLDLNSPNAGTGSGPGGAYIGNDFRNAYVPGTQLTGAGQIVGLLEFDGYYASDISKYVQKAGYAPVQLENVFIDGFTGIPGAANVEVALDIEVVIAIAPRVSKIVVYQAPNPSPWVDMLSRMASDDDIKVFSCSWGGGSPDPAADLIFQQMAAQGQTFFNASGDSDAFTGDIPFPSDNPYITEVGGTTLTTTTNGGAYVSETVWNWGDGTGSSGGISTFYPIPTWQQGVNMSANGGSTVFRNTPDVALTADNVFIYADNGSGQSVGGTSAAAPLWAGFIALVNEQVSGGCGSTVGFINPAIYGLGKANSYTNLMHDTVKGNNFSPGSPTKFIATPGYDLCTGWGSPTANLINSLASAGTGLLSLKVTPAPGSSLLSADSQPIFVTVQGVTNATVTASIPGLTNLTFANDGKSPDVKSNDTVYSATLIVPAAFAPLPVTIVVTAPGRPTATNIFAYNVIAPPQNDSFTSATKVPDAGAVYLANNRHSSLQSGEPVHDGDATAAGSLWWFWTPPATTNVLVDTTGSKVDNVLAIYTGTTLISLQPVASASSDVASLRPGNIQFTAQGGQSYRIALASTSTNNLGSLQLAVLPGVQPDTTPPVVTVGGPQSGLTVSNQLVTITGTASDAGQNASGVNKVVVTVNGCSSTPASGTSTWAAPALLQPELNVIQATAYDEAGNASVPVTIQLIYFVVNPDNDFFAKATPLLGASGTNSIDTSNATKETGEPNHAGNAGGKSVWWSFTAPADGELALSTAGSSFDTVMAVYTGSTVSDLTPLLSNDDAYPGADGGYSFINQAVHSNITYQIAVDGFNGVSGTNVLSYSFSPVPLVHVTTSVSGPGSVQFASVNQLGGQAIQPDTSADVAVNTTVIFTPVPARDSLFTSWSGSITSFSAPLTLVVSTNFAVTGNFTPVAFSDDFESGTLQHLSWATGGSLPWVIEGTNVASGQFAATSGRIGNSQTSSLLLTTNFAASTGSFEYYVSSELNFDFLKFFIDGALIQQWSGTAGWTTFSFPVTSGTHTLEWRYVKDPSHSDGFDAAFIDNVLLPIVLPKDATTPAQLSWVQDAGGGLFLNVSGQPNQQYIVQVSVDLVHWKNLSTGPATGGVLRIDPGQLSNPATFYRAVVPFP